MTLGNQGEEALPSANHLGQIEIRSLPPLLRRIEQPWKEAVVTSTVGEIANPRDELPIESLRQRLDRKMILPPTLTDLTHPARSGLHARLRPARVFPIRKGG